MFADIANQPKTELFLFICLNKFAYPYRFHSIVRWYQNQVRTHALGKYRTIHRFVPPNFWVAQRVHRQAAN